MTTSQRERSKERNVYLLIAAIGVALSLFCVWYYLSSIKESKDAGVSGQLFYLILLLFGVSVSAIIFGIMNSFAEIEGTEHSTNYKIKLTGPIVGVLLVVVGGFILPKPSSENFTVTVRDNNAPLAGANVKLTLPGLDLAAQQTNGSGLTTFTDVPNEKLSGHVKIDITKDGYRSINLDTIISAVSVNIAIVKEKKLVLTGKILTSADNPIPEAEIRALGTPFFATSMTNGDYRLELDGLYEIGDNIHLLITHPNYEDKNIDLKFSVGSIDQDIPLNPAK